MTVFQVGPRSIVTSDRTLTPDLSAAKHADVLFAKEMANGDSDLMAYCKKETIPFVPFTDFTKVLEKVKEVVEGKKSPKEVLAEAA